MEEVKAAIRHFVLSNHLPGEPASNLRDDTPLQSSGILDSLAVLELTLFIQEQFGVRLTVYETDPEQFDNINDIAHCVNSRRRDDQLRAS
jgi:acyl carrier protein